MSRLKKVLGGHDNIGNVSVRRFSLASYAWKLEKVGSLWFSSFDQAINGTRAFTAVVTTGAVAGAGNAVTMYCVMLITVTTTVGGLRKSVD